MNRKALALLSPLIAACGGDDVSTSGAAAATSVVVNEISAVGTTEWIELANPGSAMVTLDGYALADSDKGTGAPKSASAMRFPAGTTLAPGGKLLVLLGNEDEPVGPHAKAACLADGPESCLFASWGLSAASGEAVHLLAPDGSVVSSTAYPRHLAIDAGQTGCRLPDLTGELAICRATPGAVNSSP